jgi:NADH:ubiquinone oxidoreductase subunit 5 (subunit L)/multisubunit Na+/H+ antiporter MnhA subunit
MVMASIGVPGLNGFVGEFLILMGTFITHRWWAVVGVLGVVVAAVYMLWAYQQAFHGPEKGEYLKNAPRDLTLKEGLVLAPLVILVVLLGVYPKPFLNRITPSVDKLIIHVENKSQLKLPGNAKPIAFRYDKKSAINDKTLLSNSDSKVGNASKAVLTGIVMPISSCITGNKVATGRASQTGYYVWSVGKSFCRQGVSK